MKLKYFVILLLGCAWISRAQTNTATNGVDAILALVNTNPIPKATATTPLSRPQGPITIQAQGQAAFDLNGHWETYSDHVQVTDAEMKLTCEWLTSDLPQNGEPVTNIVAETNVVIDFTDKSGLQTTAIGDKAVYHFHVQNGVTNETITLTRNPPNFPVVRRGLDYIQGTNIVYNLVNDFFYVNGPVQAQGWPGTNSPVKINSPVMKTNQPAPPKSQ
jgi:lipopolysaccharide export system protein LptA